MLCSSDMISANWLRRAWRESVGETYRGGSECPINRVAADVAMHGGLSTLGSFIDKRIHVISIYIIRVR